MQNNGTIEAGSALNALAQSVNQWTVRQPQFKTPVPGLMLYRHDGPTEPTSGLYEPCVCVVAQGRKSVSLGEDTYVYDARNYLVSSLHVPGIFQVLDASPEQPFLGICLILDLREISQLVLDSHLPPPRREPSHRGMATGMVDLELISAFQRLVNLLSSEQDIPILAPLILREIYYRLLTGEQGARIRHMATTGSITHQIAQAISWLKENFRSSVSMDELAARVSMSASTFYQHFRTMTAVSPLQYQKQLRLHEARRLMLEERFDASTAAFEVGYESPSQFNREYSRLFGAPPMRDIASMRRTVA